MMTQAQFVAQLQTVNKHLYLGGPSRVRKQSSMLPLVNALQAFGNAQNGANYLNVHTAIHNLPPGKKVKYAGPLRQLQMQMTQPVYVTPNPFTVHLVATPGIAVARDSTGSNHQTDALMALQQLHGVAAGAALMQAIVNRILASGKRVGVTSWDFQQTNKCAVTSNGDNAKSQLAYAIEFNPGGVGAAIDGSLQAMGQVAGPAGYTWLQNQINACPIYDLVGPPSAIPSSTVHGANWISAATIQGWCTGGAVFPAPLAGQQAQDAKVVVGTVLGPGAVSRGGTDTRVNWSASSTQFTDTTGTVQVRPPYISLAHELIHAYHNICGDQAGHEIGTYSRVLYEYQCVGLGPWAGQPHTENAIRLSAGLALRTCY